MFRRLGFPPCPADRVLVVVLVELVIAVICIALGTVPRQEDEHAKSYIRLG